MKRCWPFFHLWGLWDVKKIPALVYRDSLDPVQIAKDVQERRCQRCGLVQRRGFV